MDTQSNETKKKPEGRRQWKPTRSEMALMIAETIAFAIQVLVCVTFFNHLGQTWLLLVGGFLLTLALILGWRARVAFETRGRASTGQSWLHTTQVVTTGVYGLVRHPMYISFILTSWALACLTQHWLSAALAVGLTALLCNDMRREELSSLERFGQDYEDYCANVPRINLVEGAVRLMRRRTGQHKPP